MPWKRYGLALIAAFLCAATAGAGAPDQLKGKYAFDWHTEPALAKCVKVDGALLSQLKSKQFHCDMTLKKNSSSGVGLRNCSAGTHGKEYLIFDSKHDCEEERQSQAANE